jgi:heme-degrading monooxygenase HmoA
VPLERAEIQVKEGLETEFIAVMNEHALPMLAGFPGVGSVKLGRGVENPGKFLLLVQWDSMDAHTAFKASQIYPGFGKLFGPFSKGGSMEHFDML